MSNTRQRPGASATRDSEMAQMPPPNSQLYAQNFSIESEDGQTHPLVQWMGSILDYKTEKMVRIQDKPLGITYIVLCVAIVCYVVFDQILFLSMHQADEGGIGSAITRFSGKGYVFFFFLIPKS